jgi:hypothetical protein
MKDGFNHGFSAGLYKLSLMILNKIFYIRILKCIVISKVNEKFLILDSRFSHGFLEKTQLLNYVESAENQLTEGYLRAAFAQGDECYGITENGELASYGWYSSNPTLTDVQNMKFHFDPGYVYMYKGLTKSKYRGQRLHAIGMTWALKKYLERGCRGMVSYVDSTNFDSLKSCWRMGYEPVGSVLVIKLFGKCFSFSSPSCAKYKIRLTQDVSSLPAGSQPKTI